MKKTYKIILLALLAVFGHIDAQTMRVSSMGQDVYPGVIRLKFTEDMVEQFSTLNLKAASTGTPVFVTGISKVDRINRQSGVSSFNRIFPYSEKHEAKHRKHDLHLWYELSFDEDEDIEEMMNFYSDMEGLEIIKPVYRKISLAKDMQPIIVDYDVNKVNKAETSVTANEYPFDDPRLPEQWHYDNFGDVVGTADSDIDLFGAWLRETGNDSVIVAIIDGGIDYTHEDLSSAMWSNEAEKNGKPNVDDDGNGYIDDIYGYNFHQSQGDITGIIHGTHVGGTVAAVSNNGVGVAGIAGGNGEQAGARLMSLQIFGESGSAIGSAQAYIYAADNGAVIAQSSWSYSMEGYFEPEVQAAIDYFYEEAGDFEGSLMKGGALFFSSGNEASYGDYYPAAYEKVVGINATNAYNRPASYTNYGESYDISAPGGDYENDGSSIGMVLSTLPNDEYGFLAGTSMATPHVSGVAALVVSMYGNDEYTNVALYAKLLDMTVGFDPSLVSGVYEGRMGTGYLNALNSLLDDKSMAPEPVDDFTLTQITHEKVGLQWIIPADSDDIQPSSYQISLSVEPFEDDEFADNELYELDYSGSVGDTVTATLSGLNPSQQYYIAVKAVDIWGNQSVSSEVLPFTTLALPKFRMSSNKFMFSVDVTKQLAVDTTVTFYNYGEGEIEWQSQIANRTATFPELIDSTKWFPAKDSSTTNSYRISNANEITMQALLPGTDIDLDRLENPVYYSAIYSDLDAAPEGLYGSYNVDFESLQATRFVVPMEAVFSLTHIQTWLNVTTTSTPLKVEVRTGKVLAESEMIYQRFYTPDTIGVLDAHIALERPIFLTEGQYFWFVISYPKTELMPLVTNYGFANLGTSYVSFDGGASWNDFTELTAINPQIIKIRAYSMGNDPSFTYLDPVAGTISGYDSTEVGLYLNVEHLRNGEHTSFVNVYTNDASYVSSAIDIAVLIEGQEGELTFDAETTANGQILGKTNNITFGIANDGLGSIEVQGVEFPTDEWHIALDDSIDLWPTMTQDLELQYTPAAEGTALYEITIKTDQGNYTAHIRTVTQLAAQAHITHEGDTLRATLKRGESTEVSFEIENTDDVEILTFDIASTSRESGEYAYSTIDSFDYVIFNDPSRWYPINEFATRMDYIYHDQVDLGFRFPFFERSYNRMTIREKGFFAFGKHEEQLTEIPNTETVRGLVAPLSQPNFGGTNEKPISNYYHAFGNRFISQVDSISAPETDSLISFQTVLYKDGTIEIRYAKVEEARYQDALIGIQDIMGENALVIKEMADTLFTLHDGDVIRITPRESASFLDKVSNNKGRLLPGDKQKITVGITPDSSQLVSGTYLNYIKITTNTVEGIVTIPVYLDVEGVFDSLTVDTNAIDYGRTYTENTYTDTIWLTNHSGNSNALYGLSTDLEGLSIRGELSPLEPHEHRRLLLDFTPQNSGLVNHEVIIKTAEADITFNVSTQAYIIPSLTIDNQDYDFIIDKASQVGTFILNNTSALTDLEYQVFGNSFVSIVPDTSLSITIGTPEPMDSSYNIAYSSANDNTHFVYHDITANTPAVYIQSNGFLKLKLAFDFYYFGDFYTTIWINKNGYITVVEPKKTSDPIVGAMFAKDDGVAGVIMPFHNVLDNVSTPYDGLFISNEKDRLVIQWEGVYSTDPYSPGEVSFELILSPDGTIQFLYDNINQYLGLTNYGLESPDESTVIDLGVLGIDAESYGLLPDSSSIILSPAAYGSIKPNGSHQFSFNVNADYALAGDYLENIIVRTNASVTDTLIPITAHFRALDSIYCDTIIDFGTHYFKAGSSYDGYFSVMNKGREDVKIVSIYDERIENSYLTDLKGAEVERYSRGDRELYEWQELLPGQKIAYHIATTPTTLGEHQGYIRIRLDDNSTYTINTRIQLVEPPLLATDGKDTTMYLDQEEEQSFSFNVMNNGADTLVYSVQNIYPGTGDNGASRIATPGAVFDSIAFDSKPMPDKYYSNLEGAGFAISTIFDGPELATTMSYVKCFTNVANSKDYNLRLSIFEYQYDEFPRGLSADSMGILLFQDDYRYTDDIGKKWRYMAITGGIVFEPSKKYMVTISFPNDPMETNILGTETCYDIPTLHRIYFNSGTYIYYNHRSYDGMMINTWIPKMRVLAGASSTGFMTLSAEGGVLAPDESQLINVTVDATTTQSGENAGIVLLQATNYKDNITFEVNTMTNAKPIFDYLPQEDTLTVTEKSPYVGSYIAYDPEGAEVTYEIIDNGGLDITMATSVIDDTIAVAQISFNTGWEDQGYYPLIMQITDDKGNENRDTLVVEVLNDNRPPVFSYDENIVINIAHGEAFTANMNDMFTDPDGDDMTFYIGNAYPELYEMSQSGDFVLITPIKKGTGYVAFAASDGSADGYAAIYYYVYIIDDATVPSQLNGIGSDILEKKAFSELVVSPNPTSDQSNIYFKLEQSSHVVISLYDTQGRMLRNIVSQQMEEGNRYINTSLADLLPGVYYYRITVNEEQSNTVRVLKK